MERTVEILSLSIINTSIEAKLSDDCQCCCQLNVVIEAKKGGFWQGKEKVMASTRKHTIEYFAGDVLLVHVKRINITT